MYGGNLHFYVSLVGLSDYTVTTNSDTMVNLV